MPRESKIIATVKGSWNGGPLTIRRCGVTDREKILQIDSSGGAQDEADYLPAKLERYLRDPNRVCYLGEIDGKPVSGQCYKGFNPPNTITSLYYNYEADNIFRQPFSSYEPSAMERQEQDVWLQLIELSGKQEKAEYGR